MEEGELSDEDNVSYETVSSVGSVYFVDVPNNVCCNESKSLDSSSVNMVKKTVEPRPTSCDLQNYSSYTNSWVSTELGSYPLADELTRPSAQTNDGKHSSDKDSHKGNKENCINPRTTHFAERLPPRSNTRESELAENQPNNEGGRLKRKYSRHERQNSSSSANVVEIIDVPAKKRKKRKNRGKRVHHRNNLSLEESSYFKRTETSNEKCRSRHGTKHKKEEGQKKNGDLLHRVISKSGPSQLKDKSVSDPLISGCAESSLMKKLVGSGTLTVKSNSVSSDLKCEIGSVTSISSPDIEMCEDLHVSSSDQESEDVLIIAESDNILDLENNMSDNAEKKHKSKSTINCTKEPEYSDDSDIEVIIPEKKLPKLVVLHSDGEEEEVDNNDRQSVEETKNQEIVCSALPSVVENSNLENKNDKGDVENVPDEIETNEVVNSTDSDNVDIPSVNIENEKEIQSVNVVSSESNDDKEEEEDDIMKLRMIALKSSKEKSKSDSCKTSSETESQSEDNMTDKSIEAPLIRKPSNEEEDDLRLRAEALKSAFLKKHNERLRKGMQVKKGLAKKCKDNKTASDKGRRSSGSSVYSPSNVTSPLSPSSSYELSLQGEEDMEIAESDVEGEIVEEVNNICNNVQIGWNESGQNTGHSVIPNSWIDENTSVANKFYHGMPSSQEYNPFTFSKHILEYSQPLPPGVDSIAPTNLPLDTYCSSHFQLLPPKLLPPPPPPPIFSLSPPPPPPLSPQPSNLVNQDLLMVSTNENVTDFVQSGNEFSVHHALPVFTHNNSQCNPQNTQFCNLTLQMPEDCSNNISESAECTLPPIVPNQLSAQGNFRVDQNSCITISEKNVTSYFNSFDTNIDGNAQSHLSTNPSQLHNSYETFRSNGGNLTVETRQNTKARPNLLEIPLSNNKNTNMDFINSNTVPLKNPATDTEKVLQQDALSTQKEDETEIDGECNSIGTKNTSNVTMDEKINNKNNLKTPNKVNIKRRKKKRLRRLQNKTQLSTMILKNYFRPPQLEENPNKLKEESTCSESGGVNNSNTVVDGITLDQSSKTKNRQGCKNDQKVVKKQISVSNKSGNSYSTRNFAVTNEELEHNTEEFDDKTKSRGENKESDNLEMENLESVDDKMRNENFEKSSNCEESDIDLSEMIVLDEVGMSPEHKSRMHEETMMYDEDDDVDILRAKALTSISTKVIDSSKIDSNENTFNSHIMKKRTVQDYDGNFPSNKTFAYVNPKSMADNFGNRIMERENSRYRLSRVSNNESVRSVVKGKSLKVVIPSDRPILSKPNILTTVQVSPPLVPRLVINVGEDSDTDEDPQNECDAWSRKVTIRNSKNKLLDNDTANIHVDVEKSVEMFLSNVRRQHEITLQNDKSVSLDRPTEQLKQKPSVHFKEPIEKLKQKPIVHFDQPVEKVIEKPLGVTEFNVTGILPMARTPIKRLLPPSQTPVRLLSISKQEEYQILKQKLASMEKLRQQKIQKAVVLVKPKPKPNNSPLKYALLSETSKKNKEAVFKNSPLSVQQLPFKKSSEALLVTSNDSNTHEDSVHIGNNVKIAANLPPANTVNKKEELRVGSSVQDLESAEKELLSERYTVIDELTEMSNLLGDFERAQEKLIFDQTGVAKLRRELVAAELRLQQQKRVVSRIQNDFFSTHEKMISGTLCCEQWEQTCSKLGVQINGSRYEIPNGGKTLLVKKLQQVSERTKKLKIKEARMTKTLNPNTGSPSKPKETSIRQPLETSKENTSDVPELQITFSDLPQTNIQMEATEEISTEAESKCNETSLDEVPKENLLSNATEIQYLCLDPSNLTEKTDEIPLVGQSSSSKTILEECDEAVNIVSDTDFIKTQNDAVSSYAQDSSDRMENNLLTEQVLIEMKNQGGKQSTAMKQFKSQNRIPNYTSPLQHFGMAQKGKSSNVGNPQAVLCPFDLMGKCLDDSCSYTHHTKST